MIWVNALNYNRDVCFKGVKSMHKNLIRETL